MRESSSSSINEFERSIIGVLFFDGALGDVLELLRKDVSNSCVECIASS